MDKQYVPSLALTLKYEGKWGNNPNDSGGETYKGIARNCWPKWIGWLIIDRYKQLANFPQNLESNKELQQLVVDFYYQNFWTKIGGNKIIDDHISFEIFDTAVNMGITAAIKLTQEALNITPTGLLNNDLINRLNQLS